MHKIIEVLVNYFEKAAIVRKIKTWPNIGTKMKLNSSEVRLR